MKAREFLKAATVATTLASVLGMQFIASACLNDRDTLEEEARNISGENPANSFLIRAISGRFERNPPLYYQMRIRRVAKELKATPDKLELYDDIAVANDRIGRDDEALRWMAQKRVKLAALPPLEKADAALREHWYRYYANAGTFYAHRWLHNGANRKNIAEMKMARDLIQKAIHIKPNAHFGREKYQLKTIQWIIDPPKIKHDERFPNILNAGRADMGVSSSAIEKKEKLPEAIKGFSGLIVLGNAWESVDVFYALAAALDATSNASLQTLAELRVEELIDAGKKSIIPHSPSGSALKESMELGYISPMNGEDLPKIYRQLRAEANQWQQKRQAFMLARLKAGRHPDTDPNFWQGYVDPGPPSLGESKLEDPTVRLGGLAILAGTLAFSLFIITRKRRRKIEVL